MPGLCTVLPVNLYNSVLTRASEQAKAVEDERSPTPPLPPSRVDVEVTPPPPSGGYPKPQVDLPCGA